MFTVKKWIYFCIVVFGLISSGCDVLFESSNKAVENLFDTIVNCALSGFDKGPIAINTEGVSAGLLGVNYKQIISSEIKSEPDDNQYTYEYTYTPSQLPPGLSFRDAGRLLYIEGVPQAVGMYPVSIEVFSPTLETKNKERPDSCTTNVRAFKTYILIIE
jgi:putative Ig domain-containing protein